MLEHIRRRDRGHLLPPPDQFWKTKGSDFDPPIFSLKKKRRAKTQKDRTEIHGDARERRYVLRKAAEESMLHCVTLKKDAPITHEEVIQKRGALGEILTGKPQKDVKKHELKEKPKKMCARSPILCKKTRVTNVKDMPAEKIK